MSKVTDGEIIELDCEDFLDDLHVSYDSLKAGNVGDSAFKSEVLMCQVKILAVIASSLQRIASAVEDMSDSGGPS